MYLYSAFATCRFKAEIHVSDVTFKTVDCNISSCIMFMFRNLKNLHKGINANVNKCFPEFTVSQMSVMNKLSTQLSLTLTHTHSHKLFVFPHLEDLAQVQMI